MRIPDVRRQYFLQGGFITKLIKNGKIATESDVFQGDILIDGEKIKEIGSSLPTENVDELIDATGRYIIPGAVDVHTHLDYQLGVYRTADDFYYGTAAAACGGTTSIVDHMAFGPEGCSPWHQVEEYHKLAMDKAVIDYGFHGVIQHVDDQVLKEIGEIAEKEGITSFKIYLTYGNTLDDGQIFQLMNQARKDGIVIAVHCENDGVISDLRNMYLTSGCTQPRYHAKSRPARCEAEAVNRMLHISAMAGEAPLYIVHLSSREGLKEVVKAKVQHQKHFAVETCPHYLTLTDQMYRDDKEGLKAVMSPPLRKKEDNDALWQALSDGLLDVVASDHCPFNYKDQKLAGVDDFSKCPNGGTGIEERLRVMFSEGVMKGRITLPQMVRYLCTNPSRMYGLYPEKGALFPGRDADLVILDPDKEWTLRHKKMHGSVDYTCYEGLPVRGDIDLVMQRGNVLVKKNHFLGEKGAGKYLRRHKSVLADE